MVLRVAPGPTGVRFAISSLGRATSCSPVVLAALGAALDLRTAYLLAVLPPTAALATTVRKEPPCPTP